jgi:phosphate transport system permease protein
MPKASAAAAWLLVALVACILGPLFWEGLPRVDWNFLSQGVERGAYFNGGMLFEATFERDPGASQPGKKTPVLLSLDVQAPEGEPALASDVSFQGGKALPSLELRWADGRTREVPLGGSSVSAGDGAELSFSAPFDRDSQGGRWTVELWAKGLPADLERFTARFLVHRPLEVAGAPWDFGRLDAAKGPLRFPGNSPWRPVEGSLKVSRIARSGVWPMICGTLMVTLLMTALCAPFGVLSAVYLHEYAPKDALATRVIRGAINNLAGVPSIIFGLFGLGFFIGFLGEGIDNVLFKGERVYGQACVLWAACSLAALTLPVVIVATEEALRNVPQGWRSASLALGATRWQTVWRVAVPQAFPGILTGLILAIGRGAGEVAPILFTGATNFRVGLPSWDGSEKFMHLGYHVYALATQSPDVERARGTLFATVAVLLGLTFALNLAAIVLRARLSPKDGR